MTSLWLDRPQDASDLVTAAPPTALPVDNVDLVVVGAGLTGLTTALLAQRAGRSVLVLEARHVGAVATGNTTAKASLMQGSVMSTIRKHHNDAVVRAYVESNLAGQQWLRDFMDSSALSYQVETAYTYSQKPTGDSTVEAEYDATRAGGLDVVKVDTTELPYDVSSAIALTGQIQIDPLDVLLEMRKQLEEAGGTVVEGVRVRRVGFKESIVHTDLGDVRGRAIVLATGVPVLDRGVHFARLHAQRSYAMAFRVPDDATIPRGMYLSVDQPSRSIRYAYDGDTRVLLTGGNGHEVGRKGDTQSSVDDLVEWTKANWPGAELTHRWSAQDYSAENVLPVVQRLPGKAEVHIATGYNKWGITNGVASALAIVGELDGRVPSWREQLRQRVPGLRDIGEAAIQNQKVAKHMTTGWVKAMLPSQTPPAEGEGVVTREGTSVVATSTVGGRTCAVSGICTHLGGILRWNPAEKSWDCPLHGSRFAPDGRILEGWATTDLAAHDPADEAAQDASAT